LREKTPTYIRVVEGIYKGARGYIFSSGDTPHLAKVCIYLNRQEITTKLKLYDFEIIEADRRFSNE
jgi:hypothetical protein